MKSHLLNSSCKPIWLRWSHSIGIPTNVMYALSFAYVRCSGPVGQLKIVHYCASQLFVKSIWT
jgi:hypothetical protein